MSKAFRWRVVVVVAVLGGAIALVLARPVRLGLDLQGGTQITLEAQDTPRQKVDGDTARRTLEVLRRRVDALGVAEPTLQRSGDRRIIVELPGVADPDQALDVIGRTAQLAFHPVLGPADATTTTTTSNSTSTSTPTSTSTSTPTTVTTDGAATPTTAPATTPTTVAADSAGQPAAEPDEIVLSSDDGSRLRLAPARVTGDAVGTARATLGGSFGGEWQVEIEFRGDGSREWQSLTSDAACAPIGSPTRRIAIVLDDEIISSPEVSTGVQCGTGIAGGDTVITGQFTQREAKDLALLIRAGALPVPVIVVEQRTIGPTLGEAAVRASVNATLIGASLTILYLLVYYRLLGALAALALGAYGLVAFAALVGLGATLTLPGIAGFVLAVGMAVDANVLVFERIKEEHAAGRTLRTSATAGFKNAWSAIADSNATTLLAAVILFFLASGAVRGFGITLSVGVAVSMFSALVVTRVLVELAMRGETTEARRRLLGLAVGGRLRQWLTDRGPDLLGRARRWFTVSGVVVLLALTGIATRGLSFGLEFSGGRLVEYSTERRADLDQIRSELAAIGIPRAVVQESGDGNVAIRTPRLSAAEESQVKAAVERVAGPAVEQRDEFVGPTIGSELRRKAVIAVAIALAGQLLYLAFRFRWTYATAAVGAMLHDVAILLGIFAWLGKEIDGVFIAALLTVIGYSINDSVVVFDRIREQRRARTREPLVKVANDACLQTIPRTVNTGLGALFILVALYVLGGDTLTDFALALLVGIVVGTYSSVFTAAPIAVLLERLRPAPSARVPVPVPVRPAGSRPGPGPGPGKAATKTAKVTEPSLTKEADTEADEAAPARDEPRAATPARPVPARTGPPRPRKRKGKGGGKRR